MTECSMEIPPSSEQFKLNNTATTANSTEYAKLVLREATFWRQHKHAMQRCATEEGCVLCDKCGEIAEHRVHQIIFIADLGECLHRTIEEGTS